MCSDIRLGVTKFLWKYTGFVIWPVFKNNGLIKKWGSRLFDNEKILAYYGFFVSDDILSSYGLNDFDDKYNSPGFLFFSKNWL